MFFGLDNAQKRASVRLNMLEIVVKGAQLTHKSQLGLLARSNGHTTGNGGRTNFYLVGSWRSIPPQTWRGHPLLYHPRSGPARRRKGRN